MPFHGSDAYPGVHGCLHVFQGFRELPETLCKIQVHMHCPHPRECVHNFHKNLSVSGSTKIAWETFIYRLKRNITGNNNNNNNSNSNSSCHCHWWSQVHERPRLWFSQSHARELLSQLSSWFFFFNWKLRYLELMPKWSHSSCWSTPSPLAQRTPFLPLFLSLSWLSFLSTPFSTPIPLRCHCSTAAWSGRTFCKNGSFVLYLRFLMREACLLSIAALRRHRSLGELNTNVLPYSSGSQKPGNGLPGPMCQGGFGVIFISMGSGWDPFLAFYVS